MRSVKLMVFAIHRPNKVDDTGLTWTSNLRLPNHPGFASLKLCLVKNDTCRMLVRCRLNLLLAILFFSINYCLMNFLVDKNWWEVNFTYVVFHKHFTCSDLHMVPSGSRKSFFWSKSLTNVHLSFRISPSSHTSNIYHKFNFKAEHFLWCIQSWIIRERMETKGTPEVQEDVVIRWDKADYVVPTDITKHKNWNSLRSVTAVTNLWTFYHETKFVY